MKSFISIKEEISDRIGSDVLKDILLFVMKAKSSLWGEQKPPTFACKMRGLIIYKDMTGIGYGALLDQIIKCEVI